MDLLLSAEKTKLNLTSLFAGCGGLDLGFRQAGFKIVWANEWDKDIWQTYEKNHSNIYLDRRDIRHIPSTDIPDCIGIVGGPPCQSWSEAGSQRGLKDERGQLFLEYIRILYDKQPWFFLAENVSGMLHKKHDIALGNITTAFAEAGYRVNYKLLNAVNYNVPQERKRVIFVGFRQDLGQKFNFEAIEQKQSIFTLKDAIWDLRESALPAKYKNQSNYNACLFPNHEYAIGDFSSMYMSRNRVRSWHEPSFTIQASSRHAPIHPQANKMIHIGKDKFVFDRDSPHPYHRLSIRECARIQTFPDDFIFYYQNLNTAYKMIGNAVPVNFAYALAKAIKAQLLNNIKERQASKIGQTKQPIQLSLNFNIVD